LAGGRLFLYLTCFKDSLPILSDSYQVIFASKLSYGCWHKGHPVFLAQHATATCCRGCLEKWHGIPKGRELTASEQQYVVYIIMRWIDENQQGHDQTEKYVKGSSL
jgi:hypothetical protein